METTISVKHITKVIKAPYQRYKEKMLSLLGRIGEEDLKLMAEQPGTAKDRLAELGGFEDLMLFGVQEHGQLLRLAGQQRSAIQIILGNPLVALQMTQYDIRAALYAPLRLLIYEVSPNVLNVEYDLPSTLFGQFGSSEVLETGLLLDAKLEKLFEASLADPM
ncbi:hypothetical protein GCM10023149_16040 [Mucilaginibacter gynuensis]|uniref:DUF302 domain-containing protein n=1 Tax=Mucilaginibacter gynuensis TaxID=1302236 RepID=A0ABP8G6M2_9SPHI